jgi:3-hydroxyacyl-[acyl-carrier-protein] dehydratase
VASEPLFDLSAIDLNAVAMPPEEVGRLNPQCGAMRQLDHVIWVDNDAGRALGVKHISDEEFWVPLHIPGRPLMPGVLMIEAAAQLCSAFFLKFRADGPRFLGFTRCNEAVFRGQVLPGDTLYLLSEEVETRPRRFVSRTQAMVDDRLVFEATITGMVM